MHQRHSRPRNEFPAAPESPSFLIGCPFSLSSLSITSFSDGNFSACWYCDIIKKEVLRSNFVLNCPIVLSKMGCAPGRWNYEGLGDQC